MENDENSIFDGNCDVVVNSREVVGNRVDAEHSRIIGRMVAFRNVCSTSPSGGNQVDGLPPARHTEAVWVPMGFRPQQLSVHLDTKIQVLLKISL